MKLSPLTVLAGANSSGKSTLLQSILILKQTIQYGAKTRALSLNGPLIRLGTFDEILHFEKHDERISIEFSFEIEQEATAHYERVPWLSRRRFRPNSEGVISNIDGSFVWSPKSPSAGPSETVERLKTRLSEAHIKVTTSVKQEGEERQFDQEVKYGDALQDEMFEEDAPARWTSVEIDELTLSEIAKDKPDVHVEILSLSHFLPDWFQISFDASKYRAENVAKSIFRNSLLSRAGIEDEMLSLAVIKLVNDWLDERQRPMIDTNGRNEIPTSEVASVLSNYRYVARRPLGLGIRSAAFPAESAELDRLQDQISAQLLSEYEPERERDIERSPTVEAAVEFLATFLRSGVRYLGPLRDEPKPVYPLEALENTTDVGYRGEHTAAVLSLHANAVVRYVSPSDLEKHGAKAELRQVRLQRAVDEWLQYMGVARGVEAQDAGVFGNRLQVTTEYTNRKHDLTNVGVGVSQVLPIVVSALLAPRTSLMIFEQPELHLHPKVQARLADFFFAMALAGKQSLLETHSEYLIDRLRRRVAEDTTNELTDMIKLYFAEKIGGATRFKDVEISKYGAITNWPVDFFEQSQIESQHIIEAASRKRKSEKTQK